MKHINLDTLPEPVRQLIRGLGAPPEGSVFEENGRPVFRLTPVHPPSNGTDSDGEWTEAKDRRRCDLIDREIDGTLTAAERAELEDLQGQMLRHRHRVAPLPLAHAAQLLEDLERKAAAAGSPP